MEPSQAPNIAKFQWRSKFDNILRLPKAIKELKETILDAHFEFVLPIRTLESKLAIHFA